MRFYCLTLRTNWQIFLGQWCFTSLVLLSLSPWVLANEVNKESAITANEAASISTNQPSLSTTLTLAELLKNYSAVAPEIDLQNALIAQAQAQVSANQVDNNLQLDLEGRVGKREFANQTRDYNLLALHISKVVYDFDQQALQQQADRAFLEQQERLLEHTHNRHKLNLVKAYFNVLLADFQYRIDNEAMAIEYVDYDKKQDRHEIGQISDVELLAAEKTYQAALLERTRAEQAQLQTRIELATLIGQPNARPDELKFPNLQAFKTKKMQTLTLQALQEQVLAANPRLQALQQQQQGLLYALQKSQKSNWPEIRAEAWVGPQSSYPETREGNWKATVSIDVPLLDGGAKSSQIAQVRAELAHNRATLKQAEQAIRQQVIELYFAIKLLDAKRNKLYAFEDYADLYLDYTRALYENEQSTDFGDSMVRLSQANYDSVAWKFEQALLWLQLDYLMGKPIESFTQTNAK